MRTVLLVSNRRPEDSGGRAGKIATRRELMAERGWEVVVGHASEPYVSGFPRTAWRLRRQARRLEPDLILSINNPFHLHLHGYLLARQTGTPWIAELRDPIASHPDRRATSPRTWGARLTERLVIRRADRIVWHDGIQLDADYFRTKYPGMSADRIAKLPFIGYVREAFQTATAETFQEFTITYAGSFYEGWIEPHTFIDGLGVYRDRFEDPVSARFYGDWREAYRRAAERAGVADWIRTSDFVPHEEIVPVLKGSDVLLYVGGDNPGNRLNVPTKLYDYVGAGTPILAIVDPDFRVADLVRKHDLGVVVPPDDAAGVAEAIHALRTGEVQPRADSSAADRDRFSRERNADALAREMDAVASGASDTIAPQTNED